MTEPVRITFRLEEPGQGGDQPGQPAPAPRTDQPQYATKTEEASAPTEEQHRKRHAERLFRTEHDQWHGHFGQFTVTRGTAAASHAGRALRQLLRGNIGGPAGAGRQAGQAIGLAIGQSTGAGPVAAFAQGAGAGAGLARGAGMAVAALEQFAQWVHKSSDALEQMASKTSRFSPEISLALAERDVKRTMFEMNQAEKYGAQLAAQVEARTDLSIEFDRLTNAVTMIGSGVTTVIEHTAAEVLKGVNELLGLKDTDEFKQFKKMLEEDQEATRRLEREARIQEAQAAADAGIAPIQQWMVEDAAAEKKKREKAKRDKAIHAAKWGKAPPERGDIIWQWQRGQGGGL